MRSLVPRTPRRMRVSRAVTLLAVAALSGAAPTAARASDLPCVWFEYNLPVLGSDGEYPCSPVNRPPGWSADATASDREYLIGPYYVEAGITVPLPEGRSACGC